MFEKARYVISGDSAINMEFGSIITEEINKKIRAISESISVLKIEGIVEIVPTYCSLMIHYDPLIVEYNKLVDALKKTEANIDNVKLTAPEVLEIPTLYGNNYGPDIENIANFNNLTIDEVINIHTSREYLIYMLGFTPGFAYLGGMDNKIATPRLQSPRTKIPQGSVGIAGEQTGIYPIASPGGWQLIGRTPLQLFNPESKNPILLKAGNYITFKSINEEEYNDILVKLKNGTYEYKSYLKKFEGDNNGTI